MNDPIAVLLVLGFIEWELHPGYGVARHAAAVRAGARDRPRRRRGRRLARRAGRSSRCSSRSPGLYPVASLAAVALSFGSAAALHGSGFLAVYLTGLALGTGNLPAKRDGDGVPRGARVGRAARRCSSRSACSSSRRSSARSRVEGDAARAARRLRQPAARDRRSRSSASRFSLREQALIGWAGLRGAVPVVLATFPIIDGVPRVGRVLQHRRSSPSCSRRCCRASTIEPVARWLGVTSDEPARMPPRGRGRHGARARRRRRRARDPRGGRRGRRAAARPRAPARRARVADRARRRGAAAARLDAAGGGRPACSCSCAARWRASCRRSSSAGARARSRAPSARRAPTRAACRSTRRGRGARPTATRRIRTRSAGVEVVEHVRTRRDVPGALVVLEGRALRGDRADPDDRARPASCRPRRGAGWRGRDDDAEISWWQEVIGACAL